MINRQILVLERDCMAAMVPSGARIKLHEGTEVFLQQALGNSYTVEVFGNLARIDSKDADALGFEAVNPLADLPEDMPLQERVWTVLATVFDPEIPVNIVDLGLIYNVSLEEVEDGLFVVTVTMTLTAPGCGMGPVIAEDVKYSVQLLPDVMDVTIDLVFDPAWDKSMMSDLAQLELGML